MRFSRFLPLVLLVPALTAGVLSIAKAHGGEDHQRNSAHDGKRDGGKHDHDRHREWRRKMMRQAWDAKPTEAELKELGQFMLSHSPRRWEAIQRLSDDHPDKEKLRQMVLMRFRNVQFLKGHESRLYEARVRTIELEDEAWALSERYRASKDETERNQLKAQVRDRIGQIVDLWMEERHYRIDQLQAEVENARQRLAEDEAQRDGHVEAKVEKHLKADSSMGMDWRGHGWGGRRWQGTTRPSDEQKHEEKPSDGVN